MRKLLYVFLIIFSLDSWSQNFLSWQYNDRYFSLSAGTGTSTYFGELNSNNSINTDLSQVSVGLEARLLNRIGARIDGTYFILMGDDQHAADSSFQKQRNLSFRSRNLHFQFHVIYYLEPYQGDYYKRGTFDPYIFTGAGYMKYTPTTVLGGERYKLRQARTEGVSYKKWVTTIPIGVGGKFKVNEFLNVNLEVSYHYAFTDYLDDVSDSYASEFPNSTAELLSNRKDEIGIVNPTYYDEMQPGSNRGNPGNKDSFLQISLKAEIFLPPDLFSRRNKAILKKPSAYD